MIGYEYDDGGRKENGFKGDTGDCVPRAIAILLRATGYGTALACYRDAYNCMAQAMKDNGYAASGNAYATRTRKTAKKSGQKSSRDVQRVVIEGFGFVNVKLPAGARPTYTEAFERYGNCIVSTRKHMAAVVDGNLRDLFDGREYDWLDRMCIPCSDAEFGPVEAVELQNGSGHDECARCGEVRAVRLYEQTRERKALTVYVPARRG